MVWDEIQHLKELGQSTVIKPSRQLQMMMQSWSEKPPEEFFDQTKDVVTQLAKILGATVSLTQFKQSGQFISFVLEQLTLLQEIKLQPRLPVVFAHYNRLEKTDRADLREVIAPHFTALLVLFVSAKYNEQVEKVMTKLKEVFALDIIMIDEAKFDELVRDNSPQEIIKRFLLLGMDLGLVSPFVTTGPAKGPRFFGREWELKKVMQQASQANSAIIGGRRIGKSSILYRLHQAQLRVAGFRTIYYDCQSTATYQEFMAAPIREWQPEMPANAPQTLGELLEHPPRDKPLVLLLDEADKLVEPDRAAGWPLFKKLRAFSNNGYGNFIFGGERILSKGMRDASSPLYNFADIVLLGPLERESVRELITRSMNYLEIELVQEELITGKIWAFTSGHPSIVQNLCHRLVSKLKRNSNRRIYFDDVDAITKDSNFQRDFLNIYWENATLLEKIVSLVMIEQEEICTLDTVVRVLNSRYNLPVEFKDVDDALQLLVDMRSILQREPNGYKFAFESFTQVVTNTMTLTDQLNILIEQYQKLK